MSNLCTILVFGCMVAMVTAFLDGAPAIACGRMVPAGHLPTRTSGPSPFALNISATSYKPGDVITGTLYSPGGEKFRGFLIEVGTASDKSEDEKAVGSFMDLAPIAHNVCGTAGITHNNKDEKDMVMFTWKAPDVSQGDLSVRATVVQQYFPSKYWLGTFSSRLVAQ